MHDSDSIETEDYKPGPDGTFPDGKFYPTVQTIGETLSGIPTDDHKMLIIRLEQPYYDYAKMEYLIQLGIDRLAESVEQIQSMLDDIRSGKREVPHPLKERDIRAALHTAYGEQRQAELFLNSIRRPHSG